MFDELVQKLSQCHQANYEVGQTFIRVLPSGSKGFPVLIEWVWAPISLYFLTAGARISTRIKKLCVASRSQSRATTDLRLGARWLPFSLDG